jgi:hypothetical protein
MVFKARRAMYQALHLSWLRRIRNGKRPEASLHYKYYCSGCQAHTAGVKEVTALQTFIITDRVTNIKR